MIRGYGFSFVGYFLMYYEHSTSMPFFFFFYASSESKIAVVLGDPSMSLLFGGYKQGLLTSVTHRNRAN
jgi:hypothetical protein